MTGQRRNSCFYNIGPKGDNAYYQLNVIYFMKKVNQILILKHRGNNYG